MKKLDPLAHTITLIHTCVNTTQVYALTITNFTIYFLNH